MSAFGYACVDLTEGYVRGRECMFAVGVIE